MFVDGTDAVTLDPHASPDVAYSFNLIRGPAEPLVEYRVDAGPNGPVVSVGPRIASEWHTDDSIVWDFTLNEGVMFSDGTPCDADAVRQNFERIISMNLIAGRLGPISSVEAPDARTVIITLPAPNANFIYPMTQMLMISPTAWKANETGGDLGQAWAAENIVGTGPYVIKNRTKGSETNMAADPKYWRGWAGTHAQDVTVRVVKEAATRSLLLQSGEAQLVNNISVADLTKLETTSGVAVSHVQAPGVQMAGVRFKGPTADVNVRQAITWAFDSEGFIASVMQGRADAAHGLIYPEFPYFNPSIPAITQDMDKARSYLAKSGSPNGGFKLTFLILPGFAPFQTDMATIWQQNLSELDITLDIQPMTAVAEYFASLENPNGADLWAWLGAAQTPDHNFQARRQWATGYERPKGVNGGYSNPELDDLLDQDQRTTDPAQKKTIWFRAQEILNQDMPFIPFFIPYAYQTKRDNLQGVPQNPFDLVPNYYDVAVL